jgi:hypothetical protein
MEVLRKVVLLGIIKIKNPSHGNPLPGGGFKQSFKEVCPFINLIFTCQANYHFKLETGQCLKFISGWTL